MAVIDASPPSDTISSLLSPYLRIPVIQKRAVVYYSYRSPIPYWVWIIIAIVGFLLLAISCWLLIRALRRRKVIQPPPVPLVVPSQYQTNAGMYPPQPNYYPMQTAPNPNQHLSGYYAPATVAPVGDVLRPAPAAQVAPEVRGFYEPKPAPAGVGGQGAVQGTR